MEEANHSFRGWSVFTGSFADSNARSKGHMCGTPVGFLHCEGAADGILDGDEEVEL